MTEINFLSQRRITLTKVGEKDAIYEKYSMWVFGVVFAVFAIVVGVNIFSTNKLKATNESEKAYSSSILNEESTEMTFLVFTQKLKTVKDLYQNRSNKQQSIEYFSNLFGSQVFLSGMNYGGEENQLSLRLTSENIFALEKILDTLDSDSVKKEFSAINKSGLRRDDNGSYNIDIAVELLKQGETADANAK
ncbi:MAG: hypothetical protein COU63_04215 [Candidatus Pacebacteria bacterium CG10_big_fil_rev_8_21_14_0_10_36_11]|nr:hypothetical protein [Candidatus Pacearchaeota archaeon]OIP74100.1 MAG: hypothetical protein AUK08_02490 [Candidatus Pacebacteria bacterium CG2_30_36_39]PIR64467.1 MAG: hypothetical protein COU63_04215 [Candidatus Pacebacteria bacterium CG10_big_fil_rev_8_21_14_0_10_36_11]PJC42712.1 MAG: hypothetical protein CO040_03050 [Candidatus Pacebacteria bacterium CG_4_9_14_0_2_um_filter_36_8]